MDLLGIDRTSQTADFLKLPWKSSDFHGVRRTSLRIARISTDFLGLTRTFTNLLENSWNFLEIRRISSDFLEIPTDFQGLIRISTQTSLIFHGVLRTSSDFLVNSSVFIENLSDFVSRELPRTSSRIRSRIRRTSRRVVQRLSRVVAHRCDGSGSSKWPIKRAS